MRALLGYPSDESVQRPEYVTINLLQTMRYLFPYQSAEAARGAVLGDDRSEEDRVAKQQEDNNHMLEGLAAYQVTSLNRELLPLIDAAEDLLQSKAVHPGKAAK
jgi:hypothetical protein